jgi:hypothetical protein
MMSQAHSTLELHQRVLADLDQREAAVVEHEAEARSVLEQALANCAAKRTSIEQERVVLVQAEKLYRRFIEMNGGGVPEDNAPQPEPVQQAEQDESAPPLREPSVMELRRLLWNDNRMDGVMQHEAWVAGQPPPGAPMGPPY